MQRERNQARTRRQHLQAKLFGDLIAKRGGPEPTRLGMISYAVFCLKKKMTASESGAGVKISVTTSCKGMPAEQL